jgi:hypothetical protein
MNQAGIGDGVLSFFSPLCCLSEGSLSLKINIINIVAVRTSPGLKLCPAPLVSRRAAGFFRKSKNEYFFFPRWNLKKADETREPETTIAFI